MCAEKDAATCHRSLLPGCFLSQKLPGRGINLLHISHEGALETQSELEQRLVDLHTMGEDLFMGTSKNALFMRQHRWRPTRRPKALAMLVRLTVLINGLYIAVLCVPTPHYHKKSLFLETPL